MSLLNSLLNSVSCPDISPLVISTSSWSRGSIRGSLVVRYKCPQAGTKGLSSLWGWFFFFFFLIFIYLTAPGQINKIPACGIFVVACEFLAEACRSLLPDQGLNLGLLHWEHRVLAIGPPDKFLLLLLTEAIGLLLGAATKRQAYLFLSSL